MGVIQWLLGNWVELLVGVVGLLGGVLVILNRIPGNQGEPIIKKIKNAISKVLPKK